MITKKTTAESEQWSHDQNKLTYTVREKISETADVVTLRLALQNKLATVPPFIPGQFITVYFPELGTPEGKAYSISSTPSETTLAITVKAMGEFSCRLSSLAVGDALTASLPYGYFYTESEDTDLIMLAGGIGVAPFRSMICDVLTITAEQNSPQSIRHITLLYSVRTVADIIFKKEFDNLQKKYKNFHVTYFITREKNIPLEMVGERIDGENIKNILKKNSAQSEVNITEFLLCGSISFTRDMWHTLRLLNTPEENILTEAFFSH